MDRSNFTLVQADAMQTKEQSPDPKLPQNQIANQNRWT